MKETYLSDRKRNALISGVIGIFILTFAAFLFFRSWPEPAASIQHEVKQRADLASDLIVPKIYVGEQTFRREELFRFEKSNEERNIPIAVAVAPGQDAPSKKYEPDPDELALNDIEQVYSGEFDDEPGIEILAAGRDRAFILTQEGKVKREIDYDLGDYKEGNDIVAPRDLPFIRIADLNSDGKPEIAGHGAYACEILDLKGKVVWKYPVKGDEWSIDALRVGDIDNDGRNEILVKKDEMLEAFMPNGRRKWSVEVSRDNTAQLEITDVDKDGRNEIVTGRSILNSDGQEIGALKIPNSFEGYLNQKNDNFYAIALEKNKLTLFGFDQFRATYEAPLSYIQNIPKNGDAEPTGMSTFAADALFLKPRKNGEKYLAVIADASGSGGYDIFQILYIYDSQGILRYHETIRSMNGAIAVLPNTGGTESLLVTDDGKLFKYSLK